MIFNLQTYRCKFNIFNFRVPLKLCDILFLVRFKNLGALKNGKLMNNQKTPAKISANGKICKIVEKNNVLQICKIFKFSKMTF